jgi:hypothetical protein
MEDYWGDVGVLDHSFLNTDGEVALARQKQICFCQTKKRVRSARIVKRD